MNIVVHKLSDCIETKGNIMDEKFAKKILADWGIDKLPLEQQRIRLFEKVRDIPFGRMGSRDPKDVYESQHFRDRKTVWIFEDHLFGEVAEVQSVKMSETPGRIKWVARPVGFDNEYVFIKLLGLSKEEIKALENKGVIGKWGEAKSTQPPDNWDGRKGLFF